MRIRLGVLLVFALAIAPAAAQQAAPPQGPPAAAAGAGSAQGSDQQPPVFRTGTSTVRVDVTVTDRSGRPVRTLTADDFEVLEDDRPQRITSFRLVEASGAPTDDYSLPIRNPHHAAAEAAREDVRVFVIFWDEYHIGEFQSALRAREQLKRFVLEAFGPTDLVAIVDPLTTLDAIRFTRDRRALAEQIHALKGRRGVYVPPRSPVEQAHLRERRNIEVLRAQVTATALEAVMMHLGSIREGRKSIIFVSETLGPVGGEHVYSNLMRSANHTNTAIYAFDPRGLQIAKPGASTHLLRALAQESGADAYASNDMLADLRRVVDRSSAYYLIGYAPDRGALDGKYRKISVRVKQRGIDVRARNGYWQPHAGEMARARAAAAAAVLPQPITTALTQITPENSHRPIELWAGFTTTAAEPHVTVAWAPRGGFRRHEEPAWIEVEAALNGEPIYEGRLDEPSVSFPAAAGEVVITATARNADGDLLDRDQRVLDIPASEAAPLGLSTPIVMRARTPQELKALDAGTGNAAATREFVRTDRLRVRIAPFGAAAKNAILKAVLLGARGVRLVELPIRPAGGYHEVDLPLASVAQGDFLIRLEALSDEHTAEALVAFRVR
jgi:VWFA-related protein